MGPERCPANVDSTRGCHGFAAAVRMGHDEGGEFWTFQAIARCAGRRPIPADEAELGPCGSGDESPCPPVTCTSPLARRARRYTAGGEIVAQLTVSVPPDADATCDALTVRLFWTARGGGRPARGDHSSDVLFRGTSRRGE